MLALRDIHVPGQCGNMSAATRTPGCSVNGCLCHLLEGTYVTFAGLLLLLVLPRQIAPICLTWCDMTAFVCCICPESSVEGVVHDLHLAIWVCQSVLAVLTCSAKDILAMGIFCECSATE